MVGSEGLKFTRFDGGNHGVVIRKFGDGRSTVGLFKTNFLFGVNSMPE